MLWTTLLFKEEIGWDKVFECLFLLCLLLDCLLLDSLGEFLM